MVLLYKKHQRYCLALGIKEKSETKLHESIYESSKRKHHGDLYHCDPRPSEYKRQFRENLEQHTSLFVRKLQTINKDKVSMWKTFIKVTYEDFVLDDDDEKLYYKYLVKNFESCLTGNVANIFEKSFSGQVPGTKEQSNSETWFQECCFRITESVCKNIVLIGEKIKKMLMLNTNVLTGSETTFGSQILLKH